MSLKYRTTFEVSGKYSFPLDMLRYDCCFPARSEDASMILRTQESDFFQSNPVIRLVKYHETKVPILTDARWNSFGWSVGSVLETLKLP